MLELDFGPQLDPGKILLPMKTTSRIVSWPNLGITPGEHGDVRHSELRRTMLIFRKANVDNSKWG